jgi:Ser/Thr protein kinase RdoA (MazF antagonist)
MKALQEDVGIQTPQALAGLDGELLQRVSTPEFSERFCVRFERIEGEVPKETDALDELLVPFEQLGEVNARLHEHSRGWQVPPAFSRQRWDFDGTIGADPIWGSFRACPVLTPENHRLLDRTVEVMAGRLGVFGDSRQRFGLIHADVRLANLMFHEGNIRVIDFDDSGFGWYLYDLGAALSFMEDRDDVPSLVDAWVRGYRKVTSLSAVEEQELTTFIMLRRLVLLGWIGSRAESDLAQEMQDGFAHGTCMLAERYLSRFA